MCFSATANFGGSGVLGAVGVVTFTKVKHRRELPFAALPTLFAVHQFIEGFVWLGLDGILSPEVAHDMGVNKPMCIVAMYWVGTARRILHGDHQTFFARKVCQVFREELRYLRLLCDQRAGQETRQRQNYCCERHRDEPFA
jgi:hypothetical protein